MIRDDVAGDYTPLPVTKITLDHEALTRDLVLVVTASASDHAAAEDASARLRDARSEVEAYRWRRPA